MYIVKQKKYMIMMILYYKLTVKLLKYNVYMGFI